ncbi:MAG: sigma-70 family RNA polymerase sigma factor [Planctomycetes bacterium]|nr:sigma-70 family RNA polymerase sigma factor [Planctomycetota bacterium]
MPDASNQFSLVNELLPRAVAGDEAAVDALLRHSSERLTILTRHMLGDFQRVRRWAQTDDVMQSALVRLLGALRSVKPATPRDFFALAALQIRRELLDLARHYYGPEGMGAHHESHADGSQAPPDPADARHEPGSLAQWTELHEQIGALPDEEREVVGLLFYQGLPQNEAAEMLGISLRTLQRRWHDALCKLHRVWNRE